MLSKMLSKREREVMALISRGLFAVDRRSTLELLAGNVCTEAVLLGRDFGRNLPARKGHASNAAIAIGSFERIEVRHSAAFSGRFASVPPLTCARVCRPLAGVRGT
jgi:hypothetical protein